MQGGIASCGRPPAFSPTCRRTGTACGREHLNHQGDIQDAAAATAARVAAAPGGAAVAEGAAVATEAAAAAWEAALPEASQPNIRSHIMGGGEGEWHAADYWSLLSNRKK